MADPHSIDIEQSLVTSYDSCYRSHPRFAAIKQGWSGVSLIDPVHDSSCETDLQSLAAAWSTTPGILQWAVLCNLRSEIRLDDDRLLVSEFQRGLAAAANTGHADVGCIKEVIQAINGYLRLSLPPEASAEPALETYVPLSAIANRAYGYVSNTLVAHGWDQDPPPRLRLGRPWGTNITASGDLVAELGRIFVTPRADSNQTRTADELRDLLGLGHIQEDEHLYRIDITISNAPALLRIPTSLDAHGLPPFAPPRPEDQLPCGMTRHLATDEYGVEEYVVHPLHTASPHPTAHYHGTTTYPAPQYYLAKRCPPGRS